MHRRSEFSFTAGSPSARVLPPRPPANHTMMSPTRYGHRHDDEEEARWLQASLQASPETNYSASPGGSGSGSGSGTPSPRLWAQQSHQQQLLHRQYPASAGSSPSRAQAIAGYRREMLDLVRGLPEAAYELSLRDIVDVQHRHHPTSSPPSPPSPSPPSPTPPSSSAAGGRHLSRAAVPIPASAREQKKDDPAAAVTAATDAEDGGKQGGKKKQGRKQRAAMRKQRSRSLERSVSLDTGLLIKLFLPLSIGGRKKKVSPKPDADGKNKKTKKQGNKKKEPVPAAQQQQQDEEWWTKSEFSEAGSSSRTSSTGSSNSNSSGAASVVRNGGVNGGANNRAPPARSWSRKRTGCYAFFRANRGKTGANQD